MSINRACESTVDMKNLDNSNSRGHGFFEANDWKSALGADRDFPVSQRKRGSLSGSSRYPASS